MSGGTPEGDDDTTKAVAGDEADEADGAGMGLAGGAGRNNADEADGAGMPLEGEAGAGDGSPEDEGRGTGPDDEGGAGDEAGRAVTAASEAGPGDGETGGSAGKVATSPARSQSRHHPAGFAVATALLVLGVAAVGYQLIVPTAHVERGRLARLVPSQPGVAAFNKTTPQGGEQDDTKTAVATLTAAARRSPNQTGLYGLQWVPTETSGAEIVAILLPSNATAATTFAQVRAQELAPGSFSASGLARTSTFTVAAVPGSAGAVYAPSSSLGASVPGLAITAFRYGRVVALDDVSTSNSTDREAADAVTAGEYGNLHRLGSGFSLSVTRRPVLATEIWVVTAVVLAAIAALAPVVRRRWAEKRRRAYEKELRLTVGDQVIIKHRRHRTAPA